MYGDIVFKGISRYVHGTIDSFGELHISEEVWRYCSTLVNADVNSKITFRLCSNIKANC
jgi:hypothetical protein